MPLSYKIQNVLFIHITKVATKTCNLISIKVRCWLVIENKITWVSQNKRAGKSATAPACNHPNLDFVVDAAPVPGVAALEPPVTTAAVANVGMMGENVVTGEVKYWLLSMECFADGSTPIAADRWSVYTL